MYNFKEKILKFFYIQLSDHERVAEFFIETIDCEVVLNSHERDLVLF